MGRKRPIPATLVLCAGATVAAVACGSSSGSGPPSHSGTVTVTARPSPSPTTAPPVTDRPPGHTATTAPAATSRPPQNAPMVVTAYFDAINAHDYRAAWDLGGRNLSGSYASFVRGFAGTAGDRVHVTGSTDSSVAVVLEATQTDGSVKEFAGTYTVRGDVIVGASVRQTGTSGPSTPGATAPGGGPYADCAQAHAHGRYDIPSTDPAYARHLDRDGDGFACERGE